MKQSLVTYVAGTVSELYDMYFCILKYTLYNIEYCIKNVTFACLQFFYGCYVYPVSSMTVKERLSIFSYNQSLQSLMIVTTVLSPEWAYTNTH